MDASPDGVGGHVAVAVAAGAAVTKQKPGAAAIRDRLLALKRAIARKSAGIDLSAVEDAPTEAAGRAALAKKLDEIGASKDRAVVTTAKELLGLIKVDEDARAAVDAMIGDVEDALVKLSDVDVEAFPISEPKLAAATTSRRQIPPEAPSRTELERSALPIWKRTERFFTKAAIVAGAYVVLAIALWLVLRTPPNEALDSCREGDKARCWQVVAAEDAVENGQKVSAEPLRLLCDKHQDACACAGLAYVRAGTEHSTDCTGLMQASVLDPKWACTCKRYDFWRLGQQQLAHCGVPRCE
jgi:hypothetical protein